MHSAWRRVTGHSRGPQPRASLSLPPSWAVARTCLPDLSGWLVPPPPPALQLYVCRRCALSLHLFRAKKAPGAGSGGARPPVLGLRAAVDCPQGCDCETGRPPGKRAAGAGGRAAEADGAAASSAPPARGERQDRPRCILRLWWPPRTRGPNPRPAPHRGRAELTPALCGGHAAA